VRLASGPLDVGERHHRRERGRITREEHRELVHEVANCGLAGLLPVVNLRGKEVSWDLQLVVEIAHLLRLGFKVCVLRMAENKIEYSDAPPDVLEFMFSAIAHVLSADLPV
jgi:hypothetical protein